jgi:hypothetical protein
MTQRNSRLEKKIKQILEMKALIKLAKTNLKKSHPINYFNEFERKQEFLFSIKLVKVIYTVRIFLICFC